MRSRPKGLFDGDPKAIERKASVIGLLAFAGLAFVLYGADRGLSRLIDPYLANMLVAFPAFFAFLVIMPVTQSAERWLQARACVRSGGHYFTRLRVSQHGKCGACGHIAADILPKHP